MTRVSSATVDAEARERLGIDELLADQRRAVQAATEGRDTLVVMPTGSGKSAVYQLAGELRSGPTIVVSPLLALQHDQLRSIAESGLSRAAAANSMQSRRSFDTTIADFAAGKLEFLFVSPEQLARREVLDALARGRPSLFVVDEAHCISMWGHDFRPDYLTLGDAARAVGRPPVLALTASAAPPVRAEIVERLGLEDPVTVVASFDRPEIDLSVRRFVDSEEKRAALVEDVPAWAGPAIVYVATRRSALDVRDALTAAGVPAAAYHGTLGRKQREQVHSAFLEGSVGVVVATNAFGMGIDKPDVRVVAHLDVPGSVDSYYQEIGRAGRDGESASALLYYRPEDLGRQRFLQGAGVDKAAIRAVLGAATAGTMSTESIAERAGLSRGRAATALDRLAAVAAVRRSRSGWVATSPDGRAALERSRIEMMRAYAETDACRRVLLLGYYGERYAPPCGRCDVCRASDTRIPDGLPFPSGMAVVHAEWGPGTVMTATADRVLVWFAGHGYRTLMTDLVLERGLLVPV
jgi:ATP-dependent DNA helicase RecQ